MLNSNNTKHSITNGNTNTYFDPSGDPGSSGQQLGFRRNDGHENTHWGLTDEELWAREKGITETSKK